MTFDLLIVYNPQLMLYAAAVLVAVFFVFKYPRQKTALSLVALAFVGQCMAVIWQSQTTITLPISEGNGWQSARALAENADNNWFSRLLLEIPKNIHVPLILLSVWLMVQPKMEVRHA
jgi:hypothetical protein